MALIIPVDSTGDRRIQVLLGQSLVSIRTYWNSTVSGWYMDLFDNNGETITLGMALAPIVNVLESQPNLTRIYGQFRIFTKDGGENSTETSLGDTAQLWWFEPGEWEENEIPQAVTTVLPFDVYAMYSTEAP